MQAKDGKIAALDIGGTPIKSGVFQNGLLTGVGVAIVLNGDIYRESTFSAGEMGAMIVHPKQRNTGET